MFGAAITNPIKWAIVPPTLFSRFYFHFLHNWEEARRFLIWYGLVCATLLFMVIRWYFVGFCVSKKSKDAIKKWVGYSYLIRVINLHLKIISERSLHVNPFFGAIWYHSLSKTWHVICIQIVLKKLFSIKTKMLWRIISYFYFHINTCTG